MSFQMLSREYTTALLAGTDYLLKSLKVGERKWIDEYRFWIRLYEPEAGPFKIKLYKIDTRFRRPRIETVIPLDEVSHLPPPGHYSDKYLVCFDGWLFPQVASVYWSPGRDQKNDNVFGYTIQIPREDINLNKKDLFLHVPIEEKEIPEWCLGGVVGEIGSVED